MKLSCGTTRWSEQIFVFNIIPAIEFFHDRCLNHWSIMFNWFNFFVQLDWYTDEKSHPNQ
jgi:hypothetical protein